MRAKLLTLFMLLALSLPGFAQEAPGPRTLELSAASEIKMPPNLANITIAVTTQDPIVKNAVSKNASQMTSVVDALKKALGTSGKVQTGNYQVSQMSRYDEATRKQVPTGYEVMNQVRVETSDLNNLGALIDAAVSAGSNQIQSLQFSRSDMDDLISQATQAAIQKGKADAAKMATAAGVTLGNIQHITTMNNNGPGPFYKESRMMAMADNAQTPIVPGEISVSSSVAMVFVIN